MKIKISCPHCATKLASRAEHFGRTVPCPRCGVQFVVSDSATRSAGNGVSGHEPSANRRTDPDRNSKSAGVRRRQTENERSPNSTADGLRRPWKIWAAAGLSVVIVGSVVAGLNVWSQRQLTPPPPADPPALYGNPVAAPSPAELEEQLKSPNRVDLGGAVTWKKTTPDIPQAAFVGPAIREERFTRWPIRLDNVLSDLRLREMTESSGGSDYYFKACLWSEDETSALIMTSDQHLIEIDVASRTIRTVLETQGLSKMSRCREGWVIYQDAAISARQDIGGNMYVGVPLVNIVQLDDQLEVRQCLRERHSQHFCASPQSSWVYTDLFAFDLKTGTIQDLTIPAIPRALQSAFSQPKYVLSADGNYLYRTLHSGIQRFRTNGATLTEEQHLKQFWGVSADGRFLFGRAAGRPPALTVFHSDAPAEPIADVPDTERAGFKVAADGRRILRYHSESDETDWRVDLHVIEADRTLAIPVIRARVNQNISLGDYFVSPSGRTALVAGSGAQPESIFWLEFHD